jgi:hypothetical protein
VNYLLRKACAIKDVRHSHHSWNCHRMLHARPIHYCRIITFRHPVPPFHPESYFPLIFPPTVTSSSSSKYTHQKLKPGYASLTNRGIKVLGTMNDETRFMQNKNHRKEHSFDGQGDSSSTQGRPKPILKMQSSQAPRSRSVEHRM